MLISCFVRRGFYPFQGFDFFFNASFTLFYWGYSSLVMNLLHSRVHSWNFPILCFLMDRFDRDSLLRILFRWGDHGSLFLRLRRRFSSRSCISLLPSGIHYKVIFICCTCQMMIGSYYFFYWFYDVVFFDVLLHIDDIFDNTFWFFQD